MKKTVSEALSHIRLTPKSIIVNPSYVISALKYAGFKESDRLWELVGYSTRMLGKKALTRRFFNAVNMGDDPVVENYLKQVKEIKAFLK